jgi:hypothetical protein
MCSPVGKGPPQNTHTHTLGIIFISPGEPTHLTRSCTDVVVAQRAVLARPEALH